eukprot:619185-Amphidinium_carterae.1
MLISVDPKLDLQNLDRLDLVLPVLISPFLPAWIRSGSTSADQSLFINIHQDLPVLISLF